MAPNTAASGSSRFDPNFTKNVIDAMGPKTSPRVRFVMGALIEHVHDFARDVELTVDEWMMGVQFLNAVGQISDKRRNEGQRISDVIGLESLVDEIAHTHVSEFNEAPTSSTILGPFWSPNAPFRENGESIIQSPTPNGEVSLMHGQVIDLETKKPIAGAIVDIWQASTNGKYDFQDPENQSDNNLRGKFRTDAEGKYHFYCLHPTAYSLPTDGPAGLLLNLLDRHPMRPAHIHLMISHPDHMPVTTQLFPSDDQYLKTDSVFAVKDDLLIDFKPLKGDKEATLEFEYNIVLPQRASKAVPAVPPMLNGVDAGAPATTNGQGMNGHGANGHGVTTNGANGHAVNTNGANGANTNGSSISH